MTKSKLPTHRFLLMLLVTTLALGGNFAEIAELTGGVASAIEDPEPPSPLSTDLIFSDGFESGDTSNWSSTVPPLLAIITFKADCPFGFCTFDSGQTITFTVIFEGSPQTYEYDWNSPDGLFRNVVQSSSTPIGSHAYATPGVYKPVLRILRGAEAVDQADQNDSALSVY